MNPRISKSSNATSNDIEEINPTHYKKHPSGVEAITIIQEFPFNVGAAVKHLWRAGLKGDATKDLRKAIRYIQFEIARLEERDEQ